MTYTGRLKIDMLEVPDDPEEIYNIFYERGWTDRLPVIPPTEKRVTGFLRGMKKDPDEVLGTLPHLGTMSQ
jgi:hypothetical protein